MEFTKVSSDIPDPRIFLLVVNRARLNCRPGILQFLTACDRFTIPGVPDTLIGEDYIQVTGKAQELAYLKGDDYMTVFLTKNLNPDDKLGNLGKVRLMPTEDKIVYGVYFASDTQVILMKLQPNGLQPPLRYEYRFELVNGMIDNYQGDPVVTDVGKYVINQFVFVNPLGDVIPYQNKKITAGDADNLVAKAIIDGKAGRREYNKYIANGYWFGADGSITVPCWSEKSIGTDPRIAKRKKELLATLKDEHDYDRIAEIEAELIQMDKDWLKGDSSEAYWKAVGAKAFNEERKKNYIAWGMTKDFGAATDYVFVPESLEQGWNQNTVWIAANDIRKASYGRSMETANGGYQTKLIMRIFQGLKITEEDCRSKQGLHVLLTESNYKDYNQRYLISGELTTLDFLKAHIGETICIRSPMFCKTEGVNYCYKCCGEIFRRLQLENVGLTTLSVGSQFLSIAMATLHQGSVKVVQLHNFSRFLRQ